MSLIEIFDLKPEDIRKIWKLAQNPSEPMSGNVAWSFEGNGIRTRTTFISAFRSLGLSFTELPNFLKTTERPADLSGYLDSFYDIYVIRESNHARLQEFSRSSRRPVVNAMSAMGHPCEVLSDAGYIDSVLMPIEQSHICLYGPPTNVFNSWHQLAQVLGIRISHVYAPDFHRQSQHVSFTDVLPDKVDVVITDGWPKELEGSTPLSLEMLASMGNPHLLPTPPFSIGRELTFDPVAYQGFVGYQQKEWLLQVQMGILRFLLQSEIHTGL